MAPPPPLPGNTATTARVLRIADLEGKSVVVIATISALTSLWGKPDWFALFVSLLAVGCGVTELRGARLVRAGDERGMGWLVRAELGLMATVILYSAVRFATTTPASVHASAAESLALFSQFGVDAKEYERTTLLSLRLTYATVAVVTVLFQGGLARYFRNQRATVAAELTMLPANNPQLTTCPACHGMVSRAARACPHCGHPLEPVTTA